MTLERLHQAALFSCVTLFALGCGGDTEESGTTDTDPEARAQPAPSPAAGGRGFKPVTIAGLGDEDSGEDGDAATTFTREDVRKALNPLQIMIGSWEVIPSRTKAGVGKVIKADWAWDYKTDPKRPALVFDSEFSPLLRSGRLTYLPESSKYQLVVETEKGENVTLEGAFTEEVRKVEGDNGKLQLNYKLELVEVKDGVTPKRPWKTTFTQADNNRYRLSVQPNRGPLIVLGSQREDTSFARGFDDYGDRECIVSQGLGTSTVSYQGKTYYVCCSGCRAAFEEDPEYWIAKAAERKK